MMWFTRGHIAPTTDLNLSEGVITLLLPWSRHSTDIDQLVNALRHRSINQKFVKY